MLTGKDIIKVILWGFVGFIIGCGLLFGLSYVGLVHYKIFKPTYENVRRQAWEETKSYTYGMVQDLAKYKYEWEKADPTGKAAIENMVRVRFANFPPDYINNPELRAWFEMIIAGR